MHHEIRKIKFWHVWCYYSLSFVFQNVILVCDLVAIRYGILLAVSVKRVPGTNANTSTPALEQFTICYVQYCQSVSGLNRVESFH